MSMHAHVLKAKRAKAERRHKRVRRNVFGTAERPRLAIFRSLKHIYAQVVDDVLGRTLCSASTQDEGFKASDAKKAGISAAAAIGKLVAERARAAGLKKIVFDRGGFRYHGRVKALADAARKGGLEF